MGILNLTPDSFYQESRTSTDADLLKSTEQMLTEGATFIDLGGYSSRPGATDISAAEEMSRVLPAVKAILQEFPDALISIDTFRADVARACIEAGAAMINDISAGQLDQNMLETVGDLGVPYIMMHMRGNPQTMKNLTDYDDLIKEILYYFSERVEAARGHQINDIIVDPGFGFAKKQQQNYELLNQLEAFKMLELPLLVGISRKSMIYKPLGLSSAEALNGTTALHTLALYKGADILRVHDVKAAVECVTLIEQMR